MGSMEAARVKKAYLKLLLAFEQHLSQDCKVEVRKVCAALAMSVMRVCLCVCVCAAAVYSCCYVCHVMCVRVRVCCSSALYCLTDYSGATKERLACTSGFMMILLTLLVP